MGQFEEYHQCTNIHCHACNGSGYDCFDHQHCEFCGGSGEVKICPPDV